MIDPDIDYTSRYRDLWTILMVITNVEIAIIYVGHII
jgi:hypothetical protein